jgi:transcriptional repressor NrdR
MHCPFCRYPDSRVIDSRTSDDGLAIRRRRQCPECGRRFSTTETASLMVIKRSGVVEPFSREKIVAGVRKACQGRPVTDADLAQLAQKVEEALRATGASQLDANDIGLAILPELRQLDEVAYLRFASVYQAFENLDDFEVAIGQLRRDHGATADEA